MPQICEKCKKPAAFQMVIAPQVLEYYDKLKPSCVDAGVSYEERVARREAEIKE